MEKRRSKEKTSAKDAGSILPPTKRSSIQNCLPMDKKKDRKWSLGGLLRRISSGQQNDASSNEEDITYIPGHALAEKRSKKFSGTRIEHGKIPDGIGTDPEAVFREESNGSTGRIRTDAESAASSGHDAHRSQDYLCVTRNDFANSPSSEGSPDVAGKRNRISRMKARAAAKRDRLRGNSSSDDDSHKSSQSSIKFLSEDGEQRRSVQRTDSWSRRTRGARTERYIKRMSRDDCSSGAENIKARKCTNSPSMGRTIFELDPSQTNSPRFSSPISPSSGIVGSRGFIDGESHAHRVSFDESRCPSGASVRSAYDVHGSRRRECEKLTWPKSNFRRTNPDKDIYGSLRTGQCTKGYEGQDRKVFPPEPPPRSAKSRLFSNISNRAFTFDNSPVTRQPLYRRYYEPKDEAARIRSCMSDNEIFHNHRASGTSPTSFLNGKSYPPSNALYNLPERTYELRSPLGRTKSELDEEQWDGETKNRTTRSLPKGVELFSRQKMANRANEVGKDHGVPQSSMHSDARTTDRPVPLARSRREKSQSPETKKKRDDNEADGRRSSRNLQRALFELEAIYNSLRLSDPDLLDRAEQRTMDEYRDNAAKNLTENCWKQDDALSAGIDDRDFGRDASLSDTNSRMQDDMAYRRMNPKERPSSVNGQSSLARISYLATSPNLSIRDGDCRPGPRSGRSSPDLTRDDLSFRSISHAINTLKVIEPQPPFGIPLGPVTGSTESDYLRVKPPAAGDGKTRSLYIPKTEPDVVGDDLAFRNLRKDKDNTPATNKNTSFYLKMDASLEPSLTRRNDVSNPTGMRKKRAVRPNSTDPYSGRDNDYWYTRSSPKLGSSPDTMNNYYLTSDVAASRDEEAGRLLDCRNNGSLDLDINGNRAKAGLQRKIRVCVPRELSPCNDNEKYLSFRDATFPGKSRDRIGQIIATESDDSERCCKLRDSPAGTARRCNEEKDNIEELTEREISEYAQLCQDLEKLIRESAACEATKKESEIEELEAERAGNESQSEVDEWERLFNEDYQVPSSILNLNDGLEVANTERDDDLSSSRSAGLSADNLTGLAGKVIDKSCGGGGGGDDDLFSSASEIGVCSNNGSLPDSVYEKFDQLLREVNDLPLIRCTSKMDVDATIAGNLRNFQPIEGRGASSRLRDDTSPTLERESVSTNECTKEHSSSDNLENLKSLTRRVRNEAVVGDNEVGMRDDRAPEETGLHPRSLNSENEGASSHRDESDVSMREVATFSPARDPSIGSDNESSTDSIYDKFNRMLREVNELPIAECVEELENYLSGEREPASIGNDAGASKIASKVGSKVALERGTGREDLKQRHLGKETDKSGESDTMLERKMRPELGGTDDPNKTLDSRQGEKIVEDGAAACNDDDECAFKETSVHKLRNICRITNSVTMCDIVLSSFLLTLLITVMFAQ